MTKEEQFARDEWLGYIQSFLEDRMKDAPDQACKQFASVLWDMTASECFEEMTLTENTNAR